MSARAPPSSTHDECTLAVVAIDGADCAGHWNGDGHASISSHRGDVLWTRCLWAGTAQSVHVVTVDASRTTLEHGQEVVFRGAVQAPSGSLVKLQRRVLGEWRNVARQATSLRHRFRFEVAPPAGRPRYRVVKPRTSGSPGAVSDSIALTVRWQPVLTQTSDTLDLDEYGNLTGSVLIEVSGAGDVRENTEAWLELLQDSGEWTRVMPQYVSGRGLEVGSWQLDHASTYRSVIPGAGTRMEAVSQPFTTPDPFVLPQNATTDVTWPNDAPRVFAVDLVAGTEYGYHDANNFADEELLAPDGTHVPAFDHTGSGARFTAGTTGRYLLVLRPKYGTPAQVTWSTTRVVPDVLDAGPLDVSGLPGQAVELTFTSLGSQFVSADPGPMGRFTLSGPDGQRIEWFDPRDLGRPYWLLPDVAGKYRLRVLPDHSGHGVELVDQQVMSGVERVVNLNDTEAEPVALDTPGRIAVLRTTVPTGVDLVLSTDTGNEPLDRILIAPDGSRQDFDSQSPFITVRNAQEGEYVLLASAPNADSHPLTASFFASTPVEYNTSTDATPLAFDLGSIPHRNGSVSFPVNADHLVSLEIRNPDGSLCDTWQSWRSGPADVWVLDKMPTPVRGTADGIADIHFQACEQHGTLQFRPMVTAHLTPTGPPGTAVAPVRINEPGQLAMVTRDYNQVSPNRYRITGESAEATGSPHWALHMGWKYYDFSGMDLSVRIDNWTEAFLWTGDTGTGAMDLTFTYQSTW